MQIYHIHPEDGDYLATSMADADPMVPGSWLVPAHAVTLAPPMAPKGQAACWVDGSWQLVEDHRGESYLDAAGNQVTLTKLGAVPAGYRPVTADGTLPAARGWRRLFPRFLR